MSHAVLPGIVMAFIRRRAVGRVGAFGRACSAPWPPAGLNANSRVKEDTMMGIVYLGHVRSGDCAACQRPLQPCISSITSCLATCSASGGLTSERLRCWQRLWQRLPDSNARSWLAQAFDRHAVQLPSGLRTGVAAVTELLTSIALIDSRQPPAVGIILVDSRCW